MHLFLVGQMAGFFEFNSKNFIPITIFRHYISFYHSYFDNCESVVILKTAYWSVIHCYYYDPSNSQRLADSRGFSLKRYRTCLTQAVCAL